MLPTWCIINMMENSATPNGRRRASAQRRQHSKELLRPPKGPGVPLVCKHVCKEVPRSFSATSPSKTFRTEESSVLSRVKTFLPQLQQADTDLKQRLKVEPPGSFDIEEIAEGEPCIQLDLALVQLPSSTESSDSELSDSDCSDSDEDEFTLKTSSSCRRGKPETARIEEITEVSN